MRVKEKGGRGAEDRGRIKARRMEDNGRKTGRLEGRTWETGRAWSEGEQRDIGNCRLKTENCRMRHGGYAE